MGLRLRGPFEQVELREWHEMREGEATTPIPDAHFACAFLRDLARSPFEMAELRHAVERSLTTFSVRDRSDEEVVEQVARLLAEGRLLLVPIPRYEAGPALANPRAAPPPAQSAPDAASSPRGSTAPRTPLSPRRVPAAPSAGDPPESPTLPIPPTQPLTSWITFNLVDEDTGAPVSGVSLRVKGPDGGVSVHTTDAAGTVHLPSLPFGTCDVEEILDPDALEVVSVE